MKAPVLVPKNVAEALEHMLKIHDTKSATLKAIQQNGDIGKNSTLIYQHFNRDMEQVFDALAYGYIVEMTPEEKLREYYSSPSTKLYEQAVMRTTLTIMGLKVEGVNA
jgi:hypothetical protein